MMSKFIQELLMVFEVILEGWVEETPREREKWDLFAESRVILLKNVFESSFI